MKRFLAFILFSCCLLAYQNSFAIEYEDTDSDEDYIQDMFSEYIHENSSGDDSKSTEIYENSYVFEYYPYLKMEYTSKTLKDKDIRIDTVDKKE